MPGAQIDSLFIGIEKVKPLEVARIKRANGSGIDRTYLYSRPTTFDDGQTVDTPCYDRPQLRVGHLIAGPAILIRPHGPARPECGWPVLRVGDSGFGKKPGPIAFSANNANDLHWTNVRTKRNERWPNGPERIGRRSNVLSDVSNFGILGEQPEGAVE